MEKETYKGREIIIDREGMHHEHHEHGDTRLTINGESIHVMKSNGKYASHYLPYENYDSLIELAKAIIDNVPIFKQLKK